MKHNTKKTFVAASLSGALLLTGCSTIADPDKVGLYYNEGNSDGYQFGKCIEPGQTGDAEWNNSVVYLPTSLRTWNIAPQNGDSNEAVVASTKPEEGQPSGVEVKVWTTTSFFLNTFCDTNGGAVREFWEKIGRRYSADTEDGWAKMLKQTLVPTLEKTTQAVTRLYSADALVGNIGDVRTEAQKKISEAFTTELKRLVGGDFFCGPAFNRASNRCDPIEMIIRDVNYNDEGIQAARNEKQKAVEIAAAKVAEAQGVLDAANKMGQLYQNKAWVELKKAELAYQSVVACAANPNCSLVLGGSGNIITGLK